MEGAFDEIKTHLIRIVIHSHFVLFIESHFECISDVEIAIIDILWQKIRFLASLRVRLDPLLADNFKYSRCFDPFV